MQRDHEDVKTHCPMPCLEFTLPLINLDPLLFSLSLALHRTLPKGRIGSSDRNITRSREKTVMGIAGLLSQLSLWIDLQC